MSDQLKLTCIRGREDGQETLTFQWITVPAAEAPMPAELQQGTAMAAFGPPQARVGIAVGRDGIRAELDRRTSAGKVPDVA